MIGMGMGGDNKLDFVFVDSIGSHVKKKFVYKTDVTWIDKGGDLCSNQITVAIISGRILPGIRIDAIC